MIKMFKVVTVQGKLVAKDVNSGEIAPNGHIREVQLRNAFKNNEMLVLAPNGRVTRMPNTETLASQPVSSKKSFSSIATTRSPKVMFDNLENLTRMVGRGIQPSLLITGDPGLGKTFVVKQTLDEMGLTESVDFVHFKGRATAAGMFITLYENSDKIVVFDDCDSIWKSEDAVNILKGALDSYGTRQISWLVGKPLKLSDGNNAPKTFDFTGRVIFISNLPQRKIDDAVKSRSFVIEVALTPEDMIKRMRKELKDIHVEVPLAFKQEALDIIESAAEDAKNLEVSMRTLVKAIKILKGIDNLELAKRLIMQQCSYK
jgi:hypothetical protein